MLRHEKRFVFVDVEAVRSTRNPIVIQIAAIATDGNFEELAGFEAKVKLAKGSKAKPAHSRYDRKVWAAEGRDGTHVAYEFAAFLTRNATTERFSKSGQMFRVAQLVAHNAAFDTEVLKNWFAKQNVYLPASYLSLCTLQRAMWHVQETPPADFQLGTLCRHFGIEHTSKQAHDAFADVRATVLLYRALNQGSWNSPVDRNTICLKPE